MALIPMEPMVSGTIPYFSFTASQNGLTGKSGTFEHMTLIPGGIDCYCGRQGCAECYCSGNSLLEPNMELDEFFARKEQRDASCLQKWNNFLVHLSMLINNLHMVIESPVILGGHITPYFAEDDIAFIRSEVMERSTFKDDTFYIVPGKCRNDAVSIGAALPFVKAFLEEFAMKEQ